MRVKIIVAVGSNGAIGLNNNLPWHLPNDFKFFKEKTQGFYCIMGRKSFESLGKPLPNRTNVVVTRSKNLLLPGAEVVHSLEQGLELARQNQQETCFIIGGAQIYKQALSLATDFYITKVHKAYQADTFFPEVDWSQWQLQWQQYHPADAKHQTDFTFEHYVRAAQH